MLTVPDEGPPELDAGPAYRLYRRALILYDRAESHRLGVVYRRALEVAVRLAVLVLTRRRGISFPSRAIGGWRWIWRWRLEFLLGWNELESVGWCRRLVRPGMTVVDAGAHIGYYTRLFAELVGPAGRVLAVEPERENYSLLLRNIPSGTHEYVEAVDVALSDEEGEATLYVAAGHSIHSLVHGYMPADEAVSVRVTTLDRLLEDRGIERVDFVKIDVEGAEPRVLAGMMRTIARSPGLAMIVECNPDAIHTAGGSPDAFVGSLRASGFRVAAISSDRSLVPPVQRQDDIVNLLCLHGSGAENGSEVGALT
jgi:FkbM family methyltransferase